MKVLVTGGSGYLGQILVSHLSPKHEVSFTYFESEGITDPRSFKVNFETGEGLKECLRQIGDLDVIVNCAAISQTGICQTHRQKATKINVPTRLIESLLECYPNTSKQPLLIHLSSDQVYDGTKAFWTEEDDCRPVNHYGLTKLEAEKLIQSQWDNFVILRSSLIYGPTCRDPVIPSRFLKFVINSLLSDDAAPEFFSDEYRCPVFAKDIAEIMDRLISKSQDCSFQEVFNMGGPDRLNRVQMAQKVACCLGLDQERIRSAESASVVRAVPSPLDISMNSEKLSKVLDFNFTSFSEALRKIYPR